MQGSWEDPVSQAASIDSKEKQQFLDRIAEMEKQMKAAELAAHSAALNLQEEKKKLVQTALSLQEEKKRRVQAEKQLRENPRGLSYIKREAEKLAKSRTIFERWRDAIRKKEARKRKSSKKGPGTVTVTKGQILDAFHKHETSCAFSTESNVVDRETDAATRLHKGRGKGSKGFEKKGQKLRKMAISMLQANLHSPVESRGPGVGGVECGSEFLLNLLITLAASASTVRKFVKIVQKSLASVPSFTVTLAPVRGNRTRKRPTKARNDENNEIGNRPPDVGNVSESTLIRAQYAFHLALDKRVIRVFENASHVTVCFDISTTGTTHALNIVFVAHTVMKAGKDAMGNDTHATHILRHACGMTASDKMRKNRSGDHAVAACVPEKLALASMRAGLGSVIAKHPSVSIMCDGGGENTGDGPGSKDDFCGNGSPLRDVYMTHAAFYVVFKKFESHLRNVYGFYGKDFEELVEDTAARPPPERLPTDQKIYSVPENYVLVRRLSMPANPLRFTVLIEGGAPSGNHCLKHIMSLANGDVMVANKELSDMAIAVVRFFRNPHVWSRMNSIILQIFASNGSKALEGAGGGPDLSMAWQAGQEDIWCRTRVLEHMMQTRTVLMPCHGAYVRWLTIIRSLALLACILHVLLAATVIASGQGLERNIVAMARDILSGRGLDDKRLVRFEDKVGDKVCKASQPYFVLYAGINRFLHVLVWSLIDDATSRNKDCCILYIGGATGIIRTLLWILERKMYVHWQCPEGGKKDFSDFPNGIRVDNGIQNPNDIQRGWNSTYKLAHRGLSKANPGRGVLTLKQIRKGERGLAQVRKMFGTWGNMVDAPSIQEMFHLLPGIIRNVSHMKGGGENVIPPGHFRDSYAKLGAGRAAQDTPEQRELAAWWFLHEMTKKTIDALVKRYAPYLYSPLAFLAAAGDNDQRELTLPSPCTDRRKTIFYVSTSTGRANACVFYLQAKELIAEYAAHGNDLSRYVQKPLSDALEPNALDQMREYARGKKMAINRKESEFLCPISSFPLLSGLPDKANARIASNQGVESNFSLTAQVVAAGSKRMSERYYHAGQCRNQNVNGKEQELREDPVFLASFKEARTFMRKPEVIAGEEAIFDGNVEESEKRKQAAMSEMLPNPVKDGREFTSSNIEMVIPVTRKNKSRGGKRPIAAARDPRGRGRGRGSGAAQRVGLAQQAAANRRIQKRDPAPRGRGRGRGGGAAQADAAQRVRQALSAASGVAKLAGDEAQGASVAGDLDVGDCGDQPDDSFEASVAPLCAESVGEPAADGETDDALFAAAHAGGESVAGGVAHPAGGAAMALAQDPTGMMAQAGAGAPSSMEEGESESTDAAISEMYAEFDEIHESGHDDQRPEFVSDSIGQESDQVNDSEVPGAAVTGIVNQIQDAPQPAEVLDTTSTDGLAGARPEDPEVYIWTNHPFVISDKTWPQVKKRGNPARCDYTRLLLQTFRWVPSQVTAVKNVEGKVDTCTLKRLDGLSISIPVNSGNRFFVLWGDSGLELILITKLFIPRGKKQDDMMARYFRVQSTKAALQEANSEGDVRLTQQAGGRSVHLKYLGQKSLRALLTKESKGDRRSIGRTFHAGGVLLETKVENIVSFVGWVPEAAKSDTKEDIARALNVSSLTDIDWVFSGEPFDERPLETGEESEEDDSSESDG